MTQSDYFGAALACAGLTFTFYVARGANTWVLNNHWIGPALIGMMAVCAVGWQWQRSQPILRRIGAVLRRTSLPSISRLKFGQYGSATIRPKGTGHYSVTTIRLRNEETHFPNCCEGIRAELHFRHLHIEELDFKRTGRFVSGNFEDIRGEAVQKVDLKDGEQTHLVLFVSGPWTLGKQPEFFVLDEAVFRPSFKVPLALGEWHINMAVSSAVEDDSASKKILLKIERNGSSSMIPIEG